MRANRKSVRQPAGPKKGGRLLLKSFLVMVLITGIFFGGRYIVNIAKARLFPVKEIAFIGNKHLSDSELKSIMGVNGNEGLLRLSGKELSKKLLKSPWVKAVAFRKEFPNRWIVMIEEASPLALLEMKGRTFFVDDKGNILEEIKNESVPFLPVIVGDPFKDSASFPETLSLVKAMKEKGFINTKNRVEVIIPNASGPEEISIQADGMLVKVGYGEYGEKLDRLLDLEGEISKRGIPVDYIDLRFANKVVVKPVNEVIR